MSTLVTGGTGLIGRHLVPHLLARGPVELLVRDPSRVPEAWSKLGKLRVHVGDLTSSKLELGDVTAHEHVFHLAALYDLSAPAARLEQANLGGTRNLLDALRRGGFKGTFHHVSSVAVAGDFSGVFPEDELVLGQTHPDPYHRTKYEAERLVRGADGLRWRIYRPSAVVGHSKTGEMVGRIDGPYFMFEMIRRLKGAWPRWLPFMSLAGAEINMVPVDWVAKTIDELAHRDGWDGRAFHLVDPEPPSFAETFNLVADAAEAPRVPTKPGLIGRLAPGMGDMISAMGSAKFLKSRMVEDLGIPRRVQQAVNSEVRYASDNLLAALGEGGRPPAQSTYVEALWDYYRRNMAGDRTMPERRRALFRDRRVLITGASSGIGASLARAFAEADACVVLVARREAELAQVAEGIRANGGRAEIISADLSTSEGCDAVVQRALERGAIDVLVNNAGRSIRRPLTESLERFHDLERTMQINYFAPARLIRGFLPGMLAAKRGIIVNVLSAGAHMPSPRFGAYTASKAALSQLGDTLAAEHAADDIQVTQAYLHWVRTPMMTATGAYEDTQALTPEQAASQVIDAVVEGKPKLMRSTDMRRYLLNIVAPRTIHRMFNLVYRIYSDQDGAYPELDFDRKLARRVFKGRPV